MSDLEGVLNGEVTEAVETVETETVETVETEAVAEKPTGEKEAPSPGAETEEATDEPDIQTLQQKIDEYEKRVKGLEQAASAERHKRQEAEKQEKPEFWEDPEKALSEMRNDFGLQLQQMRIDMSENYAKTRFDDYEPMREKFAEMAEQNQVLVQQMLSAEDPAAFAYQTAKAEMERKEFGSVSDYKKALEAQVEKKAEELAKEKLEKLLKEREDLPGSVTDIRAAGKTSTVSDEPLSLDNILNSKR